MKKNLTVTVGIPTYEAGDSLLVTLASLYSQTAYKRVNKILIVVDGHTILPKIRRQIRDKKVEIIQFKKRCGQSTRINDLCTLTNTDCLILTNDDVVLEKNAVSEIIKVWGKRPVDLLGCRVETLPVSSPLGKGIAVGKDMNRKIARFWNKGDNYLHCNGRLIVLSKRLYSRLNIPELVWNNDAYIYLYTKLQKMRFSYTDTAIASYQLPKTWKEHIKQSLKFQLSHRENKAYFTKDIERFYHIPLLPILKAAIMQFVETPLWFTQYIFLYITSRMSKKVKKTQPQSKGYWETDISTKEIYA